MNDKKDRKTEKQTNKPNNKLERTGKAKLLLNYPLLVSRENIYAKMAYIISGESQGDRILCFDCHHIVLNSSSSFHCLHDDLTGNLVSSSEC